MKLFSLLSAVALGMAVPVHAQEKSVLPPPKKTGVAKDPNMHADGSVTLSAGTLVDVLAEIERRMGHWTQTEGGGEPVMPNILYGPDAAYSAEMPGELRLRQVSPLQAVALAAAAAGCTLEPIFAPKEAPDAPAQKAIGYRIVRGSGFTRLQSSAEPMEQSLVGVGLALAKTNGNIVVGQIIPGSPASFSSAIRPGQRILRVAEGDQKDVDVTGLGLEKIVQMIRGAPETVVKITLGGDSGKGPAENVVKLVREKLPVKAAEGGLPKVRVVSKLGDAIPGMADRYLGGGYSDNVPAGVRPGTDRGSSTLSARRNEPIVRVYAIGFIMTGTDLEKRTKMKAVNELIEQALSQAKLDLDPEVNIHQATGALILRATAAQHEIIEQAVQAMKENATLLAAPAKP